MSTHEAPPLVDVSVCIATFRRDTGLRRLLTSLRDTCADPRLRVEVIVVDNDAEESARNVVRAERATFPGLHYVSEPRQSISHARNAAVAAARGTWLAFIDDDEEAEPGWLQAYWAAARRGDADGFFGPVVPVTAGDAPPWFRKDVFFAYAQIADGALVGAEHTRTGNAFLRRDLLAHERFDPAFGLTGGGDYELFARLLDAGARFRWCAGARTRDYIPVARLDLRWLLQRAFRGGYTYTVVDRRRHPGVVPDAQRIAKALAGIALFAILLPFEMVSGWPGIMRRLRRICIQAGHLWAHLGPSVEPYRRQT